MPDQGLRHPAAAVRAAAVAAGARVLDDAALEAMLRDGADAGRRNGAVEMLKRRGPAARRLAEGLLGDRDPDVVLQALSVLAALTEGPACPSVIRLLTHANLNVVQAAVGVLGISGDPRAVMHLLPLLEGDSWLRVAAIEALGNIGHPVAVPALASALEDPALEPVAARALGRIGGSRACEALAARVARAEPGDPVVLEALAEALERRAARLRLTPAFVEAVTRRLAERRTAAARCALLLTLRGTDARALDLLEAEARVGDPVPACLLRRDDLVPALLARGGALMEWGFRQVARHRRAEWTPAVADALANRAWRASPEAIADAVLAMDAPALAPAILTCYAHLPPMARTGWGPVLQRYRGPIVAALPSSEHLSADLRAVLQTMVENPIEAAAAIAAAPLPARVEAISLALTRPDVLSRLPWLDWLTTEPATYARQAVAAAEAAGLRRELPAIRLLLKTPAARFVVPVVAELRDEASVPLLADLLGGAVQGIEALVLPALGRIGGDTARAVLRLVIERRDPGERFAYRALAACADACDVSLLRAGLTHADWHVRMVCMDAVASLGGREDAPRLAALCADPVPAVAERAREWAAA